MIKQTKKSGRPTIYAVTASWRTIDYSVPMNIAHDIIPIIE